MNQFYKATALTAVLLLMLGGCAASQRETQDTDASPETEIEQPKEVDPQ